MKTGRSRSPGWRWWRFLCGAGGASLGAAARADDWPQWRGPGGDGVWRETGVVAAFARAELKPVWSAPLGPGYSGPTVADDRVFVTDWTGTPEPQERVRCFDRATGRPLWTHAYRCAYRDLDYALGPRAAVTVAHGRAFAIGALGHAHCLDVTDGRVRWARDLATEMQASVSIWGIAAAPLVAGDLVIYQIGGQPDACLVALEAATGRERWRALDGPASYSTPRLIRAEGREVLLAWTGKWLAGLDVATGKVLWQKAYQARNMVHQVADPVLDETGRLVFLTAFYDGSLLYGLRPDFSQPELRWRQTGTSESRTKALHSMIMTPLIREGHIYGIDSHGELRCLDLATGERVWEDTSLLGTSRWATAHFVQNGDRTWITTEKGEIVIARLTPRGFERLSSARYITPQTVLPGIEHPVAWSHPAYAQRCLFARNDSELVCISLAAERP